MEFNFEDVFAKVRDKYDVHICPRMMRQKKKCTVSLIAKISYEYFITKVRYYSMLFTDSNFFVKEVLDHC